jgi:hypothetical protein
LPVQRKKENSLMPKSTIEPNLGTQRLPHTTGTGGGDSDHPRGPGGFTPEEHRWVQREIERCAHQLWSSSGAAGNALDHWLRAEQAVLEEFIRRRLALGGGTRSGDSIVPPPVRTAAYHFNSQTTARPSTRIIPSSAA